MMLRQINASSTVEAALILPLIIAVIFGLIRLMFFMYVRIKLDADLDRAATEASLYVSGSGRTVEGPDLLPFINENIDDYPGYTVISRGINKENGRIETRASLKLMDGSGFTGLFAGYVSELNASVSVRYWDSPKIKRLIDVILRMKQDK